VGARIPCGCGPTFLVGFFVLFCASSLFSQTPSLPQSFLPQSLKDDLYAEFSASSWWSSARIGALPFEIISSGEQEGSANLDPLTDYLARFLPSLLLTRVPELPSRPLNPDEVKGIYTRAADAIRGRRMQILADHLRQQSLAQLRDQVFTYREELSTRAEEGKSWLDPEILDLELLQAEVPLSPRLPLEVVSTPEGFEVPESLRKGLRESSPFALEAQAKEFGVEYLLLGSIELFGDESEFLGVNYSLYSRFSREIVLEGNFFSSKAVAPEVARDEARKIAIELSEQPQGRVQVTVLPPVYEIRVNGQVRGIGQVDVDMIPIGEVVLEVLDREQVLETKRGVVDSENLTEIGFLVPPPSYSFVPVVSVPSEVPVLIDGVFLGITPFLAPLGAQPSVLEFNLSGYHRRTLVTNQEMASQGLSLTLLDDRIDWTYEVETRRDRFYGSLGITVLTTLVPLVLNGIFQEAATLARANLSNATLVGRANDLYWIRNTSYLLTGVSAGYTLFELGRYIAAARAALTR